MGIDPAIADCRLQGTASSPSSTAIFGGAEEIRTPDLYVANVSLSQLSYGPNEKAMMNYES